MLARFRGRTEGMQAFDTFHIPGVIYKANGREGGHVRLFRKPCGGLSIYAWNQTNPEWPLVERWYIPGLLTIARVTPRHRRYREDVRPPAGLVLPVAEDRDQAHLRRLLVPVHDRQGL